MNQRSTWACALLATSLCLPAVARGQVAAVAEGAQPAGPRSHTVREGDTLWEIARLYLRDPFLWPEVYRLNTGVVEDPHWIFPGEQLVLPDASATVSPIITAAAAPTTTLTTPEEVGPPTVSEGPTIFRPGGETRPRPTPIATQRATRVDVRAAAPTVREWEYYAAPWVEEVGGPRDYGRILMTAEIQGIGARIDRTHIQLSEKIYITTPASVAPQAGDRYLVYSLGPQIPQLGQVVLPTGIVEVLAPGVDGEATTVRVVKQFDEIAPEHRITPLEPLVMPPNGLLTAVGQGMTTDIRWMQNTPLLPTIQQYVVLAASGRDGIQLGDRFTFLRGRTSVEGVAIPEEEIAEAQVIRVTDRGVTAIVVDQTHPSIREGMMARLTAVTPEIRR